MARDIDRLDRRQNGRRTWRMPLAFRLLIAVVLAAALAAGTSYTLRTLNL